MIRTRIKIDLERVCSPTKLLLGNQYENIDHTLIFEFADVLDSMNKYVILNNKEKTLIFPIVSNEIKITSSVTNYDGVWNIHVMCRSMELNLEDDVVNMDAKENETVYISNVIRGYVEKASFKKEDVEAVEMDENIKVVYDDLLRLKAELENAIANGGGSSGGTSQEVLNRLNEVEAKAKGNADNITDLYNADYIINENIKVLNETKITDVKINDASIVENGVANIPVASGQNKHGLVQVKNSHGLMVTQEGYIYPMIANDTEIDNRTNYRWITSKNMDYAVKQALCDGKGEAYTEEEKASARKRLGLEYELIGVCTISEDEVKQIDFNVDINEQTFSLEKIKLTFNGDKARPIASSTNSIIAVNINGNRAFSNTGLAYTNSTVCCFESYPDYELDLFVAYKYNSNSYSQDGALISNVKNQSINEVSLLISNDGYFANGLYVELWGVRA